MEIGNLPEKYLRVTLVKMNQHLKRGMEAQAEMIQEMFHKDLDGLKNKRKVEKYNNWKVNDTRRDQ